MEFDTILSLVAAAGIGGFLASVIAPVISWHYEGRTFKRERRIANLEKRIDKLWRLLFYFGNMESWGAVQGGSIAFAPEVLGRYLGEMVEMMKTEMFVGSAARKLWFEWQPYAVAAVEKREGKSTYAFFNNNDFVSRFHRLHQALLDEYERLSKEYQSETGATLSV